MPTSSRPAEMRERRLVPTRRAAALVGAVATLVLVLVTAVAPPATSAAAMAMVPACDGVNLRVAASVTATARVRIPSGTSVTVTGRVAGAAWRTTCAGSKAGSSWYRVTHVGGRSVRTLYGTPALYAASGTLRTAGPGATPRPAPSAKPTPAGEVDTLARELMRLINLDRAALGRPAFVEDRGLAAIARDAPFACPTKASLVVRGRAADLAARGYFGHYVKGCHVLGTTIPYPSVLIVRQVFGYAKAYGEIIHWNGLGSGSADPTRYAIGCDIGGRRCRGGATTTPRTVALAQRSFMSSGPHRALELGARLRFGCGSARVPGSTRTYFVCLFADAGSSTFSPAPSPKPKPTPKPTPSPKPSPKPSPTPSAPPAPSPVPSPTAPPSGPARALAMAPACDGVNLRAGGSLATTVRARISRGARVTVIGKVKGSNWRTLCSGPKAGSSWYRISEVNGRSVQSLYGVRVLYAASGVLVAAAPRRPSIEGMTVPGATITIHGRGWGHGVGLSQYGARGRALAGQDAPTILSHYFPGTTIGTIPTSTVVRVLLLDDFVPSAASPLLVVGRSGSWVVEGIGRTFPANARLRLVPVAAPGTPAPTGATRWQLVVTGPTGTVLHHGPAPAEIRVRGTTSATTFQVPAVSRKYDLYRGSLRILAGSAVDLVNELSVQTYLRGVVPAEMPSSWPTAARTAQTIASRSFVAYRIRPGVGTFDVYADARSQVYRGVRVETTAANKTVTATAGRVLRSGTTVANALFHRAAGGATEDNEAAFVSPMGEKVTAPVPYLRGSSDRDPRGVPYDATSPYATWKTATYTLEQLSAILAADPRTNVGILQAIDLRNRGVSGRLVSVTLVGSTSWTTVSGEVFVEVFNAHRPSGDPPMRSALFALAPIP